MNLTGQNRYIAIGSLVFLTFIGGCGAGDYEQRLNDQINKLKSGSKFNLLSPPINVPGTQVSLRVPQKSDSNNKAFEGLLSGGFENPPLQEGVLIDGKPVDPRRLKPNVIDVSDLKLTFEGFVPDSKEGKQPYYLYVAVTTRPNRGNMPRLAQADLASRIENATQLTELTAQTPEGRSIDWKECQATGNQQFYYIKPPTSGEGQIVQLNGTIQLLFHDENDALVTLIWRWPAGIEKSIDFKSWMELVAGCVKVKSNAAAPGGE